MQTVTWDPSAPVRVQLGQWCGMAAVPGIVQVVFTGDARPERLPWKPIEEWTRTRAVTVADIRSNLGHAALDVALCADLVYVRDGLRLETGDGEVSPGLVWALGRAGRAALSRGLLDPSPISASESVALGLAQAMLGVRDATPVTDRVSMTALTTARDMMRSAPESRAALELASFRLLFAAGDPSEGARAFLERRSPDFDRSGVSEKIGD